MLGPIPTNKLVKLFLKKAEEFELALDGDEPLVTVLP